MFIIRRFRKDSEEEVIRPPVRRSQEVGIPPKKKKKIVRFEEQLEDVRVIPTEDRDLFSHSVFPLWRCNFRKYLRDKDIVIVLFHGGMDDNTRCTIDRFNLASKLTKAKNHAYAHVDCLEEQELCRRERISETPAYKMYFRSGLVGSLRQPTDIPASKIVSIVENGVPSLHSSALRQMVTKA